MERLTTILKSTVLATAALAGGWGIYELNRPVYPGTAGITYGEAFAPARNQSLDFHIWYPAEPGGKTVQVGGNGVFYGTEAGRGAPHRQGRFPAILISHGAGGNAGQFGWIAEKLADAGYVVLLPNHPGTTTGNASAEAAVRVWERPADLTAVIDEVTGHPERYPFIDTDALAVLGFSAGGYTALAVSGARVDPDRLQRFCDDTDHGMSDCAFLEHFGIDLHQMDLRPAGQNLADPRVRAAVVIDPGIVSTLTEDSIAAIDIPMLILNLGREDDVPSGVYAGNLAKSIASARYKTLPGASHFSFLAQCKPDGTQILVRAGEPDALCEDAGDQLRSALHDNLATEIISFLSVELGA